MPNVLGIMARKVLAELDLALGELEGLPADEGVQQITERIQRASRLTRAVIALYSRMDWPGPSKLPPGQDLDP